MTPTVLVDTSQTYRNLSDGTLANASVGDNIPLLVRLELLYGVDFGILPETLRLVYAPIRSRGYKSENGVFRRHRAAHSIPFYTVHAHRVVLNNITGPFVDRHHRWVQGTVAAKLIPAKTSSG